MKIFKGILVVLGLFVAVVMLNASGGLVKEKKNEKEFFSIGKVKYKAKTIIQGKWGSGENQFGKEEYGMVDIIPSLTLDKNGNLVVIDPINWRVNKYDSFGNLINSVHLEIVSKKPFFTISCDVSVDLNNNIYIIDNRISKFSILYIFNKNGILINKISNSGNYSLKIMGKDLHGNIIIGKALNSEIEDMRKWKWEQIAFLSPNKMEKIKSQNLRKKGLYLYEEMGIKKEEDLINLIKMPIKKYKILKLRRYRILLKKDIKTKKILKKFKIELPKQLKNEGYYIWKSALGIIKEDIYVNIYIIIACYRETNIKKTKSSGFDSLEIIEIINKKGKLLSYIKLPPLYFGNANLLISNKGIIYIGLPYGETDTNAGFKIIKYSKKVK